MTQKLAPYQSSYGDVNLAIGELTDLLGDKLVTSPAVRKQHGGGELTYHAMKAPEAVAFAQSTEQVAAIVKICASHKVPIVPFGAGSSLEGHIAALYGGICVDLSLMTEIVKLHAEDLDVIVQAGVTRQELNIYLRDTGLFFPVDPGAEATLAGMAATRASGTNAVRYGTMRDNVINLTVVMPDGEIVKTSARAKKTSAGYDLARLMIGSEGTLGIITELTLKLYGTPEKMISAVCSFDSIEQACEAVIMTIQAGVPMARIELLDEVQVKACNVYSKLELAQKPTLFLEFHGTDISCPEQVDLFKDIAAEFGSDDFKAATNAEARSQLWKARHDVYWAACDLAPGMSHLSTDVCVPISNFAKCVVETQQDIVDSGLIGPIVGHAGDGNFHVLLNFDENSADHMAQVKKFLDRLAQRALDYEGTCTGEHGIGSGKAKYMRAEHGAGLDVMFAIKQALDPDNIMNPGKIFYG
ncbi:MAG: FAD-binding protein [Rhizobiales bacterium]|nr:FAD-binding protein [Hyphomicrobiales bacterium]NRB13961.1 FAD-binding protein [Hyphomicrobiales bacterium]